MRVRWPTSVTGKADFVVFDTDYTNFMAVFECDRAGFYHRRSVAILSRTDTIEQRFVDRVRQWVTLALKFLYDVGEKKLYFFQTRMYLLRN